MSLNPNGAPAYYYQSGATAYLIDPAGAYSPAGASGPTTDPAGPNGGGASAPTLTTGGAYIPITGATFAAAEIGAYSPASASAETVDPAGADGGAGASAPTLAPAGAYIAAAEFVDPEGALGPAGASAPTTDPARRYSPAGARAPTLAAAGASVPVSGATSSAAESVEPGGAYSLAGASAATTDPAMRYSAAGGNAPTPAAPDASIPVTGATSAAAAIVAPPGTYLPPGATAPVADPAGTYTAGFNETKPTTDPAGTYSSPYALNRLVILGAATTPANVVLAFHSETAVENHYGATSIEASLAKEFFGANYAGTATMLFTRFGLGQRPHLLGANVSNLTLAQLQSIKGSIALTFNGYTYSGQVNLSGSTGFLDAAHKIQSALNSNLQVAAVAAGSSIAPENVSFTGSLSGNRLQVTQVTSGSIEIGAVISGRGVKAGSQIINQVSGTRGGVGVYSFFAPGGTTSSETMTESYGVLTVGAVNSGTVALGQEVTGAGVLPLTAIDGNISGSGPGSTWVVNNTQTVGGVAGENLTMTAPPLTVDNESFVGATENNDFFEIQPNGSFGFDQNPSSLSYMSGTAAALLGLTQTSGAIDSSPGGQHPTTAQYMNSIIQNETGQFGGVGSFQTAEPRFSPSLARWAQSIDGYGYQFLTQNRTTPRAGSSAPTTDPAGTYSPAGASAPTPADAGTYIPFTGATSAAQEIPDAPGTYSLAGASKPTFAHPGFYVPTARASFETPVSPGYYQPHAGASKELLALPPTISGTVAGQSTPSGQPDTPFSFVTIKDPNILTSDSLSIELTGGGGKLADGAGFSGLTESPAGVYLLSGTAAAITSELDALVFTASSFSATSTFTLTDTTSLGTSANDANTTVTVTNGTPVVVSVSTFLANQKTLDGTPGGFDILDAAGAIAANLDQLDDDLHIDETTISDNSQVGASVQQLMTDQTAIKKLQNANLAPARLAITDTTADIQAGLSTLVQDAGEIGSITVSDGPIVVSAATFLADQSTLDKIVGGFGVSGTAAQVMAHLDRLDDRNIFTIKISDNGPISVSVAQLTADATAIGDLRNKNGSPVLLTIVDTAGAVQTGLSTVIQDTGEIGSINTSFGPIVVSATTFQTDQPTLDKIAEGFDVSDDANTLVAALPSLNADPNVDAITAEIGDGTLSGIAGVNAPNFSESGWATSLTVSEALAYAGAFTQGLGSTLSISSADTLSLTGTTRLSGATTGAGTLALAGGSAAIDKGATISVSNWSISGSGTDVTLDENLTYAGSFREGANDTFVLSGGHLLLSNAATFAGGTVDGSNILYTTGTTTVSSGVTIGGTVEWENTKSVTQRGGTVTIGDTSGDQAILFNTSAATYDILDDSGIGLDASTASYIKNAGLFEKTGVTTGGTRTSVIAPAVTNTGTIEVTAASATLDLQGVVAGTGKDKISGSSTLEFDSTVAAGQTVSFTGSGGTLNLVDPEGFGGKIGGFDTVGAGSSDTIEVAGLWVFSNFKENAGGTQGTLRLVNGTNTLSLTLLGNYNFAGFHQTHANGSTLITYTGVGLDSLLPSGGSVRGDWGAGASWDGSVGHGPGPS